MDFCYGLGIYPGVYSSIPLHLKIKESFGLMFPLSPLFFSFLSLVMKPSQLCVLVTVLANTFFSLKKAARALTLIIKLNKTLFKHKYCLFGCIKCIVKRVYKSEGTRFFFSSKQLLTCYCNTKKNYPEQFCYYYAYK